MNLLDNVKITGSLSGSTHGTGGAATTWIDMGGWEGVLFAFVKTSSAVNSSGTIIIQQSSALSTGAGILQSTFSNGINLSSGINNTALAVDVYKPLKRYVRLRKLTCTGLAYVALQYSGRRLGSTEARGNLYTQSGVHLCTT